MKSLTAFLLVFGGVSASRLPSAIAPRQATTANTATVDLAVSKGPPKHLASGILYGVPDTPNQIPDHWYTDMGFNYCRSGGAQLPAPARGWTWGLEDYKNRLNSYLSNYVTCQKYGAPMILLPHDVWGTDNTNSSSVWPGDNGDWSDWDTYVLTLMADLKANNALKDLIIDIWNEPDIDIFWKRSIQQWVDLYIRTHKLIRSDASFDNVKIQGPSMAFRPLADNPWWTVWLEQIAGNNTIPEQWSYHLLGEINAVDNDIQTTNATFDALLKQYGLPDRQININEYAAPAEQIPSGAAWWISRLERYDAIGLRANWVMGASLHDLLANLLTKVKDAFDYAATDYAPNGEYQVYKYYNLNMTGTRLETTGSTDRQLDVYATFADKKVRILTGARFIQGLWYVKVDNLSALGLPQAGELTIQTWGFEGSDVWQIVNAPSDRGLYTHTYSGNSLTFPIFQNDKTTAWAFEFQTP